MKLLYISLFLCKFAWFLSREEGIYFSNNQSFEPFNFFLFVFVIIIPKNEKAEQLLESTSLFIQ